MKAIQLCDALATNATASSTAVDLAAAASNASALSQPAFNDKNVVLHVALATGATPSTFAIAIEESDTSGGSYTSVKDISGSAAVTAINFYNVAFTKRYARVTIDDATANAGTISVNILAD